MKAEWLAWQRHEAGAVCPKCKKLRTVDGHDPCIANLPGVRYACCGHGRTEGYIFFETGLTMRMKLLRVEQYDPTENGCDHTRPDLPKNSY